MKGYLIFLFFLLPFSRGGPILSSENTELKTGTLAVYGYHAFLDGDKKEDRVLLIKTSNGTEVIALLKRGNGYKTYKLFEGTIKNISLEVVVADFVKETKAGKGEKMGKIYKTPGAYVEVTIPEGSSIAYFWKKSLIPCFWSNGKFKKVFTAD